MSALRLRESVAYRVVRAPVPRVCEERARREELERIATKRRPRRAVEGAALLSAIRPSVLHALTAERAPSYVAILAALLSMRRDHELSPLVDDLERHVLGGAGDAGDAEAFARDLAQLLEWACVEKQIEPLRIRGYKDARRERFRYRLSRDAVALLEWLEARAREPQGLALPDGRDVLTDILGQVRELRRVCDADGAEDVGRGEPASARRALHLLFTIEEGVEEITEELVSVRADMLGFASGAYDARALRPILAWLERYVAVHLAGLHALGEEIEAELGALSLRTETLERHRAALETERAQMPRAIRPVAMPVDPTEQLAGLQAFFGASGRLAELCARTDGSVRDVLRRLHGHLRELERRSARRAELGRAIAWLTREETSGAAAQDWLARLLATARLQTVPIDGEGRCAPPLPRRHAGRTTSGTPPLLTRKQERATEVRSSAQRRREELAAWLDASVLGERDRVRLSELGGAGVGGARAWIDLARARHLARGRGLSALGVRITSAEGVARVVGEAWALEQGDCVIQRRSGGGSR
jgi:hypothetical protein